MESLIEGEPTIWLPSKESTEARAGVSQRRTVLAELLAIGVVAKRVTTLTEPPAKCHSAPSEIQWLK